MTRISEINIAAQCDQEWYFIHKKYIHSQGYIFVGFYNVFGGSDEILSHLDGFRPGHFTS